MSMVRNSRWEYRPLHGLAGLVAGALILVLMRDDLALATAFWVAITSAAGWTRRRAADGPEREDGICG